MIKNTKNWYDIDFKLLDLKKVKRLDKLENKLTSLEEELKASAELDGHKFSNRTFNLHKKRRAQIKILEKLADVKKYKFLKELSDFMYKLDYDQIDKMLKGSPNAGLPGSLGFLRKTMSWLINEKPSYELQKSIEKSVLKNRQLLQQMELVIEDVKQARILGFPSLKIQKILTDLALKYERDFPLSAVNQVEDIR